VVAGFYIASFWDNRLDQIHNSKEGRERGGLLLRLYKLFDEEMKRRGWSSELSCVSASHCIIVESASQFQLAYPWEGASGLESESLTDLVLALVRWKEAKLALEFLNSWHDPERFSLSLRYAMAECLVQEGDLERGKTMYLQCFLEDASLFLPEIVSWNPLLEEIQEAKNLFGEEDWKEALPVLALRAGVFRSPPDLLPEEIQRNWRDLSRLWETWKKLPRENSKILCQMVKLAHVLRDHGEDLSPQDHSLVEEIWKLWKFS